VIYYLGEYFCVNNIDQKEAQAPKTEAVSLKKQTLPIARDKSKLTTIVPNRPKQTIQENKTVFQMSK
jgi:hypothetical protein